MLVQRLVLGTVVLAACQPHRSALPRAAAAAAGSLLYDGVVRIAPDSHSVSARWTIRNARALVRTDTVVFVLNVGLRLTGVSGPAAAGYAVSTRGNVQRIAIASPPAPAEDEIELAYAGRPRFDADSINNIGPRWVELALDSFWQPVLEGYSQTIVSRVQLDLPEHWQVASGGTVRDEETTHRLTNTVPLPDVPFTAAPSFHITEARGNRVYDVGSPPDVVQGVLGTASACATYLDSIFAPAPLPPLRIVLAPRTGPGYARKNYIVITAGTRSVGVPLERFLCHEESHYWASGAVASGPENWLNEGFAEFLAGRAVRRLSGDSAYQAILAQWREQAAGQAAVWTDTTSRRPGPAVAYRKAPALLAALEERIGAQQMDAVLARFLIGRDHTTPQLLNVIGAVSGDTTAIWFRGELAH